MLQVRNFLSDESGVAAIEYALIASGISIAIITTVLSTGTKLSNIYSSIGAAMK